MLKPPNATQHHHHRHQQRNYILSQMSILLLTMYSFRASFLQRMYTRWVQYHHCVCVCCTAVGGMDSYGRVWVIRRRWSNQVIGGGDGDEVGWTVHILYQLRNACVFHIEIFVVAFADHREIVIVYVKCFKLLFH